MDITDTGAVIDALNRAAGASETWRIETYTMQRESKKHGWQDVAVRILDRGPDISPRRRQPRYAVSTTVVGDFDRSLRPIVYQARIQRGHGNGENRIAIGRNQGLV